MDLTSGTLKRARDLLVRILKNPHFWIVVGISVVLILIYQAWPWRDWQFTGGAWRFFSGLSSLEVIVTEVELKYHVIGVLFFIPIIYGSIALSWPGGIFAWLLALIWVLPTILGWSRESFFTNLALLLLPALLVAVITLERRWRERERRFFVERARERQVYIAKLVEVQEGERQRIAQEIHDETLQTLMVIANKADSLASSADDPKTVEGGQWIKQELLQTMDDLRRLSLNLRPSILDNFGLVSALRWLVNNSNLQSSVRASISVNGEERRLPHLTEVTVFRVVQEAIHNVQRHAKAQNVRVDVTFGTDHLGFTVSDDGIGFRPPERLVVYAGESKLGVIGMEQRIVSVGGAIKIDSRPGAGTTLQASVPYERAAFGQIGISDAERSVATSPKVVQ